MRNGGDNKAVTGQILGQESAAITKTPPCRIEHNHGKGPCGHRRVLQRMGLENRLVGRTEGRFLLSSINGFSPFSGRCRIPQLSDNFAIAGSCPLCISARLKSVK